MRHRGGGVGHHVFKGVEKVFQTSEHEDDLADADKENAEAEGAAENEAENFIDKCWLSDMKNIMKMTENGRMRMRTANREVKAPVLLMGRWASLGVFWYLMRLPKDG